MFKSRSASMQRGAVARAVEAAPRQGRLIAPRSNPADDQLELGAGDARDQLLARLRPVIQHLRRNGERDYLALASALNGKGLKTARGKRWTPQQVKLLLRELRKPVRKRAPAPPPVRPATITLDMTPDNILERLGALGRVSRR